MANNSDNLVIKLVLILFLSILPSLIYLLIFRKVKQRWRSRLRRTQIITNYHQRDQLHNYFYSDRSRATTKYFLGDQSCQNNAHSPYIRCAINPSGPCEQCSHYEAKNSN